MQQPPFGPSEQSNQQPSQPHIPPPYGYSPPAPPQPLARKVYKPDEKRNWRVIGIILLIFGVVGGAIYALNAYSDATACERSPNIKPIRFMERCSEKIARDTALYADHFGDGLWEDGIIKLFEYVRPEVTNDQIKQECFEMHRTFAILGEEGTGIWEGLSLRLYVQVIGTSTDTAEGVCEMKVSDARDTIWEKYDHLKAWNEEGFYTVNLIDPNRA